MQLSPETITRVERLRVVAVATLLVTSVASLLPGTVSAGLVAPLRAVGLIAVVGWLVTGYLLREPMDRRPLLFALAAPLAIGLGALPLYLGIVDETIGTTIALIGIPIGCFLGLLALMRPLSAIAFALGLCVTVALGGYAFSAGQPLFSGAIAVIFAIVSVVIMVRRVNAGD